MTFHQKFEEVKTLVEANIPVLMTGGKGSGKTTIAIDVAKALDLPLYSVTMTRQTTLGMLLGFINVTGQYIPSDIYRAARDGGVVLLDEINGGDPNVLLCLNTIENGYISFPEHGIVYLHENFRLMATQNPNSSAYTGRAVLDASTLDRFDKVDVSLDNDLEKSLVDPDVYQKICIIREIVKDLNMSIDVSMRDCLRFQKRKLIGLDSAFVENLFNKDQLAIDKYNEKLEAIPKIILQEDCKNLDELIELLEKQNA